VFLRRPSPAAREREPDAQTAAHLPFTLNH
jgi:hypothetical protein